MILVACDQCQLAIERDDGDWFGVDYQKPPVEAEPDETGTVYLAELVQLGQDHEYHFCSVDCLTTWAFARAFAPSGG